MAEPEKKEAVKDTAQPIKAEAAIAYLLVVCFDMHCQVVGSGVAAQTYHEIIGEWPEGHEPDHEEPLAEEKSE